MVESLGRAHPVETRYLGRDAAARLEPQVVRAVLQALAEEEGGVLVFLPGAAEIARVRAQLAERLSGRASVEVHALSGALSPQEQAFNCHSTTGRYRRPIARGTSSCRQNWASPFKPAIDMVPFPVGGVTFARSWPSVNGSKLRHQIIDQRGQRCETCGKEIKKSSYVKAHEDRTYIGCEDEVCTFSIGSRVWTVVVKMGRIDETHAF